MHQDIYRAYEEIAESIIQNNIVTDPESSAPIDRGGNRAGETDGGYDERSEESPKEDHEYLEREGGREERWTGRALQDLQPANALYSNRDK